MTAKTYADGPAVSGADIARHHHRRVDLERKLREVAKWIGDDYDALDYREAIEAIIVRIAQRNRRERAQHGAWITKGGPK